MAVLEGMFAVSLYSFGIISICCLSVLIIFGTVRAIDTQIKEDKQKEAAEEESEDDGFNEY